MQTVRHLAARFSAQLLRQLIIRSLRGSLLIGGAMLALSSTGLWQYMASSFGAHDVHRAAAWSPPAAAGGVVLVAVDDVGYEGYFGGRSPLSPDRVVPWLRAIHDAAGPSSTIVVDIDLSPAPGQSGIELLEFFREHSPSRWVLADPVLAVPDPRADRALWRHQLCALGVRMAAPFLPMEFGYPSPSHQFATSLAAAALDPGHGCARHRQPRTEQPEDLVREPAPMHPAWLAGGVVLPFQGDLAALRSGLASLQPRVVVVGGTWARQDFVDTPFGERFGAHVHAAAIEGRLRGLRLAPHVVQLAVGWLAVSLISVLLTLVFQRLVAWAEPWAWTWPGHRFLMTRLWPLGLTVLTLTGILLTAELLALLYARTGYWIPSATVAATVAPSVLFIWNWGLNRLALDPDLRSTWRDALVVPVTDDAKGAAAAWRALRSAGGALGRGRAVVEATLASLSMLSQTLFPTAALVYAITKPL